MTSVDILIQPFLPCSARRPLRSPVCLKLGEAFFPDRNWIDFTPRILTWWLQELTRTESFRRGRARLLFMDGPFEIHVQSVEHEECRVSGVMRGRRPQVEVQEQCHRLQVESALLAAAKQVVAAIQEHSLHDDDCERFQMELRRATEHHASE